MFTASMVKYEIDDTNKVITASASGLKYDAVETFVKCMRKTNVILNPNDLVVSIPCETDTSGRAFIDPEKTLDNIDIEMYPLVTCKKFLLPDTMSGTACYDPNDPNPYSVERGKMIARRRLYNKYNKAFKDASNELLGAVDDALNYFGEKIELAHQRIINFQYFEYYDVFKAHESESEKI